MTASQPSSHLDRALRVAALLVIIVAAVLGATEALMRAIFDAPLKPYTTSTLYRGTRTPNFHAFKICVEDGKPFEYVVNPLGFRGKSMQTAKKPAGVFRIFFVGASTTENEYLPEEKTFAGLVQTRLDEALHGARNVEVANCGIAGFGIARSLSLIEHRILHLEPDLIVLLDGENDFMTSLDERFDPTNGHLDAEQANLREFIGRKSRLFAVLDAATTTKETDGRRGFNRRRAMARARPYFVPEGVKLDHFLPGYEQYLRWIALVCKDAHVPVVFLTQPTLWKEKNSPDEVATMWMSCFPIGKTHLPPDVCAKLMATFNEGVKETAAKSGALVVDTAAAVPKDLIHFVDDAHLTAEGNARIADAILATILKDGKLP